MPILWRMVNESINLYRANFIPSLTQPRQRYAQCPVQAIVLKRDAFVKP